jgi:hypothetical protein
LKPKKPTTFLIFAGSRESTRLNNPYPNAVPDNTSSSTGPLGGFVIVPGAATEVEGVNHLLKKPDLGAVVGLDCITEECRLPSEPLRDGRGVVAGVA